MDFEKFAREEKVPVNRFIEDVFQQLADEQDFDIEISQEQGGLSMHVLIVPEPGSTKRVIPTYDELETFKNIAFGRIRDMYPRVDWLGGLKITIETMGVIEIYIDNDKLQLGDQKGLT